MHDHEDELRAIEELIAGKNLSAFAEAELRIITLRTNPNINEVDQRCAENLIDQWEEKWRSAGENLVKAMAIFEPEGEVAAWETRTPVEDLLQLITSRRTNLLLHAVRLTCDHRERIAAAKEGSIPLVIAMWNMIWVEMARKAVERMRKAAPGAAPQPQLVGAADTPALPSSDKKPHWVPLTPPKTNLATPGAKGSHTPIPISTEDAKEIVKCYGTQTGEQEFMREALETLARAPRLVWWNTGGEDASEILVAFYQDGRIGPRPWDPAPSEKWQDNLVFDMLLIFLTEMRRAKRLYLTTHAHRLRPFMNPTIRYATLGVYARRAIRKMEAQKFTRKVGRCEWAIKKSAFVRVRKEIMPLWKQIGMLPED